MISASAPKEKKVLDDEISIIKNEIAKLSAQFEAVLRAPKRFQNHVKKEVSSASRAERPSDRENKFKSGKAKDQDGTSVPAGRSRTVNREEIHVRSSSLEPQIYPEWWNYAGEMKLRDKNKLTPKITETEAPEVPRSREKVITRHHLDDELARSYFNEPGEEAEDQPAKEARRTTTTKESFQPQQQPQQQARTQQPLSPKEEHTYSLVIPPGNGGDNFKSPYFNSIDQVGQATGTFKRQDKENYGERANFQRNSEETQTQPKSQAQPSYFVPVGKSRPSTQAKQTQEQPKKARNSSKNNSKQFSRKRNPAHSNADGDTKPHAHKSKYDHIQSKIKDKVDFDREISRQYKRVKGALNEGRYDDGENSEFIDISEPIGYRQNRSQTRGDDYNSQERSRYPNNKFVFVDKVDQRNGYDRPFRERERETSEKKEQNYAAESHPADSQRAESEFANGPSEEKQDHLAESTSSILQKGRPSSAYQMNRTPLQDSYNDRSQKDQYSATKSDDFTYSRRTQADLQDRQNQYFNGSQSQSQSYHPGSLNHNNTGNILDIANNFLNSPLMQHLSSQEPKIADLSSKESNSYPNTLKSNVNITDFETKSPSAFTRSPNSRRYYDDDLKSSQGQAYRDSGWGGTNDFTKSRDQPSTLKESTNNKRYSDYKPKDSGSSLSSSNFSNFNINEDMKGFYQNVFWEQNKKKEASGIRSGQGHSGSESSSNVSFNGDKYHPGYQNNRSTEYGPRKGNSHNGSYTAESRGNPFGDYPGYKPERTSANRTRY